MPKWSTKTKDPRPKNEGLEKNIGNLRRILIDNLALIRNHAAKEIVAVCLN